MSGETILVVDDDELIVTMVTGILQQASYKVVSATTALDALRILYEKHPQLVILDVKLEGSSMDGIMVCQRIREVSDIPIIMLTAQREPEDIVVGLDAGADDYITKPYEKTVFLARVRANLRRSSATQPISNDKSGILYHDNLLTVNLDEHRVLRDGKQVKLSPTEFNLLVMLIKAAPRILPYRDLLEKVWGLEYIDDLDYLRVYVWHLRRKIEDDPKNPLYLINEFGVGYRFEKQSSAS
jgi:two-component system KDP operon response regulator KdpE